MGFADTFAAAVQNMVQLHDKEVQCEFIAPKKDMSDCTKFNYCLNLKSVASQAFITLSPVQELFYVFIIKNSLYC